MIAHTVLLALLPVAGVFGFSNTVPFVAWSSKSSNVVSPISPSTHPSHGALLESITQDENICSFDAIFVIDHPGLHNSDLRGLHPSCGVATALKNAPSSRQFPHVERRIVSPDPDSFSERVANQCDFALVDIRPESGVWTLDGNKKHILTMSMPPLGGPATHRKIVMSQHEQLISGALEKLAVLSPNHLVLYSGAPLPAEKRQLSEFDPDFDEDGDDPVFQANIVAAAPTDGSILQRYQLLTPALIMSLLLVFVILIPIVVLGITALASIQSPLRTEVPASYSAHEKKVQ
ncbi:hypothetical protein BKA82DRAFT_4101597 [Pisolithus tinctorius]|nr:hypothetical protein BKA82DRAFT_4101597 [Pisolithus tinctorius]